MRYKLDDSAVENCTDAFIFCFFDARDSSASFLDCSNLRFAGDSCDSCMDVLSDDNCDCWLLVLDE